MPWAINGHVSTDVIPDGIQITDQQYTEAISAVVDGKIVSIDGGFHLDEPPEPEPEPEPEPQPPTDADVDAERDRRIDLGFAFNGTVFQSRPQDRENIMGASTAALAAIVNGAQQGDLRWANPDKDFLWIAADNSEHPMDAQTTFALGKATMAHKEAHIFAGRAVKDLAEIPADYTADNYWPPRPTA